MRINKDQAEVKCHVLKRNSLRKVALVHTSVTGYRTIVASLTGNGLSSSNDRPSIVIKDNKEIYTFSNNASALIGVNFTHVRCSDAGTYECVAFNDLGEVKSAARLKAIGE